jgi:hypothetical protein
VYFEHFKQKAGYLLQVRERGALLAKRAQTAQMRWMTWRVPRGSPQAWLGSPHESVQAWLM